MDPTSLPTDNLYKFWTLACLVGILAFWYSSYKSRSSLREKRLGVALEKGKHQTTVRRIAAAKVLGPLDPEWSKAEHEADLKGVEMDAYDKILDAADLEIRKWTCWSSLAIGVFALGAAIGGYKWYTKVQYFLDESAHEQWLEQRAKASLAELKLEEKKRATSKPTASSPRAPTPQPTTSSSAMAPAPPPGSTSVAFPSASMP
jgi:hypothetical protein